MSMASCALVPDSLSWAPPRPNPSMRSLAERSRPTLRLVTEETTRERVFHRGASAAAVHRRRRLAVGVAMVGIFMMVCPGAGAIMASGVGAIGGGATPSATQHVVRRVVQQGDTYWSIAQSLVPNADPRPIVYDLRQARGGKELLVGDVIEWAQGH